MAMALVNAWQGGGCPGRKRLRGFSVLARFLRKRRAQHAKRHGGCAPSSTEAALSALHACKKVIQDRHNVTRLAGTRDACCPGLHFRVAHEKPRSDCGAFSLRLCWSDVEQEVQHIAVLDDVFLAFGAHLAGFLGTLFALNLDEIVVRNRLGADKAAFKVGVDGRSCARGRVADVVRSGAHFLHTGGEVSCKPSSLKAARITRFSLAPPCRCRRGIRPCRRHPDRRFQLRWRRIRNHREFVCAA